MTVKLATVLALALSAPAAGVVLQSITTEIGGKVELADYLRPGHFELYYTPPIGVVARKRIVAAPTTQHGIEPGFLVSDFRHVPMPRGYNQYVVYLQGSTDLRQWVLYAIDVDGLESPTRISPPAVAGGSAAHGFVLSRGYVRFACDCVQDERYDNYVVPLPGTIFGDGFEGGNQGEWR